MVRVGLSRLGLVLLRRDPQALAQRLHHVRTQQEASSPGSRCLPVGLPGSTTVRKKVLSFLSQPVCGTVIAAQTDNHRNGSGYKKICPGENRRVLRGRIEKRTQKDLKQSEK